MSSKKLCKVTSQDSAELTEAYAKLSEVYMRMANSLSGKRSPAVRDPNKPKRPMTGYLIFLQDKFQELKRQHPDKVPKDIMTMGAEAWKGMDEDKRRPFMIQAEALQTKYQGAMAEYESKQGVADHTPAVEEEVAPPKKAKKTPSVSEQPSTGKTKEKKNKSIPTESGDTAAAVPKKKKKSKDVKSSSE
ncbi:High mobility group [Coemansia sp. S155-1]|nr:High mobility group [Coemansia sp. S155-1]